MRLDQHSLLICYLLRNSMILFGSMFSSIQTIEFSPDSFKDLEILDRLKLENQIKFFLENNKIHPSNVIMVLSESVLFERDIVGVSPQEIDAYSQDFVDTVPFEHVSSQVFDIQNGKKIIATNSEVYELIGEVFQDLGFSIITVVAETILGKSLVSPQTGMDTDISYFLKKMDYMKSNNFAPNISQPRVSEIANTNSVEKEDKKRLYILLGIFVFVTIIFIFIIVSKH